MDVSKRRKNSRKSNKRKAESDDESKSNIEWSNNDKNMLLKALKTYGPENISAISKMLPNIPAHAIKSKMLEYSTAAKELYKNELLDRWLKCGLYEPGDSLVPEALLFIQLFEDHPPPSDSDGYDLRAIYKFLYQSCLEKTSGLELSKQDRILLCSVLEKVENKVWPKCQKDIWEYVGRVYNKRNIKKVYPGKNVHSL